MVYNAFPDLPLFYDAVGMYNARRDIAFYVEEAGRTSGAVLELGCGTGRVLLPVARAGKEIHGVDSSQPMLDRLQRKLEAESADVRQRVTLTYGDVRSFELKKKFSLITVPFRVVQHLVGIEDQLSFLAAARKHLEPGGQLVFDVFNPNFTYILEEEHPEREDTPPTPVGDGRTFRRTARIARVRKLDQVSEIELVYYISSPGDGEPRKYVQSFDMRWFLKIELLHLLARGGFRVRAIYGDFDRSQLTDDSPEQIVCAQLL